MAALLLAGSAAYAALKWRTVLPALVETVPNALNVAQWSAEPIVVALAAGGVAAYAIATEDDLTDRTRTEELAFAVLSTTLGGLVWPSATHWTVTTAALAGILTATLVRRDNTNWWWLATAASAVGYAATVRRHRARA